MPQIFLCLCSAPMTNYWKHAVPPNLIAVHFRRPAASIAPVIKLTVMPAKKQLSLETDIFFPVRLTISFLPSRYSRIII